MKARADWRRPFLLILGAVLLVEITMSLLDMGPESILVAAIGALVGVTIWSARSLADTTRGPQPTPRAFAPPRAIGADSRVKNLRTSILFGRSLSGSTELLHENLIKVIDDQLLHAHGIDRAAEPAAAAATIGQALTAFVTEAEAVESVADTKQLSHIITLIEQI